MAKKATTKFQVSCLEKVIKDVWKNFRGVAGLPSVDVQNTIPITWFGDLKKYEKSKLRIVTIGINPSFFEFREKECHNNSVSLRFKDASHLAGKKSLNNLDVEDYVKAMNNYFEENPYARWFNFYEKILRIFNATYGSKLWEKGETPQYANHAIHIDACTAIATNPTWGGLCKNCKISLEDFQVCKDLLRILSPDIVLISTSKYNLNNVFPNYIWYDVITKKKNKSIYIKSNIDIINISKNSTNVNPLIVWGSNRSNPFSGLTDSEINTEMNKIKSLLSPKP